VSGAGPRGPRPLAGAAIGAIAGATGEYGSFAPDYEPRRAHALAAAPCALAPRRRVTVARWTRASRRRAAPYARGTRGAVGSRPDAASVSRAGRRAEPRRPEGRAGGRVSSRTRLWQGGLALSISALLLWWALREVHFGEALDALRAVRPGWLLATVAVATATFPLRLVRWRLLLRAEDGSPYGWTPLWHATAMGFAGNNVLPLRAGEVIRTVAATRLAGARLTVSLASIAVERVFDSLTVVGLLALALVLPGMPEGLTVAGMPVQQVTTSAALLALGALVAAALVVAFPRAAERAVHAAMPSERLAYRVASTIEGIAQGLGVLRSPGRLAAVVFWSVALWLVNALSFELAFRAFELPVGFAGALLLQGVLAFGIALPSAPGYVGPFEAIATAVLAVYGIDASRAIACAVGYHVTTFFPITLLGLASAARTGLGLRAAQREGPPEA